MEQIEHITSDDDLKKYRTETPNIVDDLNLSPHAHRVYSHYRRACGAHGKPCTQSTKTIAGICNMSVGKVSESKKELVTAGLIQVTESTGKLGVQHSVTVCNIWSINFAYFDKQITLEQAKDKIREVVHNMNGGVQNMNDYRSQYELKKEQIQERTIEESLSAVADVATVTSDTVAVTLISPKKTKTPKAKPPVHPLFQKEDTGQNPFFNVILKQSFGGDGASAADTRGSAGQVAKILKTFEPLYDELNGFTPEELTQAYQQWLNQHPTLSAPRATEKVYTALAPLLRKIIAKRSGLLKINPALQDLIKPRPSLVPDYIIKE